MIKEARREDKSDVYALWKHAYPNMSRNSMNFYFKHIFDRGICVVKEQDGKIVSSMQMQQHVLHFRDRKLMSGYLLGVATLPDYRRRGYMKKLMETMLDEAEHTQLLTFVHAFHPRLYEPFGFHTVYYHRRHALRREALARVSRQQVFYSAEAWELLQAYERFTAHFDGYYERDVSYYELLQKEVDAGLRQLVVYRDSDGTLSGYLIFSAMRNEVHVQEAIYQESAALMRMLKAAIGKADEILVDVSKSERLEKLFPLTIPKMQPYLMARVNDFELFNKLYGSDVASVKEAFALLRKPLWNHARW